jgi:hypothetical protein
MLTKGDKKDWDVLFGAVWLFAFLSWEKLLLPPLLYSLSVELILSGL